MLDTTLVFIRDQLNSRFDARFPGSERPVVLADLCDADGSASAGVKNRIVLSLVNVEQDANLRSAPPRRARPGERLAELAPPLNLNLYLLVSASFEEYERGLEMLSVVLGHFDNKPLYTRQGTDRFPDGLDSLAMELVNLDMERLGSLWSNMGVRYLPSVLYKARLLTLSDAWLI